MADSIIPREIRWLWYPYVPSSAASLIFGPGGHGKSHITVDMAAALSRGRPLPGQTSGGKPQKVLMLSAEDDFDAVLVPRLMQAGADLSKIAFPKAPFTIDADGMKMLEDYQHEFAATVVFIDPVVSYIGSKIDINKANQTREFTGGLHQLAMKKQSSIIIVGHSRKGRQDDTSEDWEKAMGSADFSNAVRSVMFVTKSSDGSKVMRHVKANYSPLGPTLGFEFGDHGFVWTGEKVETNPFQAGIRAQKRNKQEEWLRGVLSEGPIRADEVPKLAKAAGMSMSMVNRVKSHVAESYMQHIDGKPAWFWTLRPDVPALGDDPLAGANDNQPVGDVDDELPIQSMAIKGRAPGGGLQSAPSGRRGAGGRVEPGARDGNRGSVSRLGGVRQAAGDRDLLPRAPEPASPDPKAIARAFMRSLPGGSVNE